MAVSDIVIWHNPRCSKSREALALLQARGEDPVIRKYLEDVPSLDELRLTQATLGLRAIEMMRTKEKRFAELGLSKDAEDAVLLRAMSESPVLIERPIVFASGKAAIGRPPERVLDIL
ncbi:MULTISPECIES: arsenate reductase (glutaredoxin) [Actibacterium]|uniref:arsenate reductase (glutaredoxin) n=1 Tax=Actibacterium TaxID=1433986 RepID=UPI0006C923C0|nr:MULTISPECIES: arsenate reductase (glutaredoxin) [Actibacterium]ALG89570.1 arsenate reductase [Actibacterium sp. EMB200-NS6]